VDATPISNEAGRDPLWQAPPRLHRPFGDLWRRASIGDRRATRRQTTICLPLVPVLSSGCHTAEVESAGCTAYPRADMMQTFRAVRLCGCVPSQDLRSRYVIRYGREPLVVSPQGLQRSARYSPEPASHSGTSRGRRRSPASSRSRAERRTVRSLRRASGSRFAREASDDHMAHGHASLGLPRGAKWRRLASTSACGKAGAPPSRGSPPRRPPASRAFSRQGSDLVGKPVVGVEETPPPLAAGLFPPAAGRRMRPRRRRNRSLPPPGDRARRGALRAGATPRRAMRHLRVLAVAGASLRCPASPPAVRPRVGE